jgi:predicted metal-dependent enzyme (double-stranded beta helix superfamily)
MLRFAALFLVCAACGAQTSAPLPDTEVPQLKGILRNHHVTASVLELAPGAATPMHQHSRDTLVVFLDAGHIQNSVFGHRRTNGKLATGETEFHSTGYAHAIRNTGMNPLRAVVVEFADPQGRMERAESKSRYCNPGSTTACVDEKNLFCTAKVCVEDVTFGPGAVSTRHSHSTDHMLVAVSDYEFSDQVEGKGTVVRTRKSGEVEYIAAGISHQLTNSGKTPARFLVISWK